MFKIGDIVRGIKNTRYAITNERMLEAKILNIYESTNEVVVEILKHEDKHNVGESFTIKKDMIELINNENKKENEIIVDDIYRVLDNTETRKADIKERITYNEKEVKRAWNEIASRKNALIDLKRDLEILQSIDVGETKKKVKMHIDNILSLPQVKKLDTYGSELHIYTNQIDFYDTQGNKFKGNHYKIEMNVRTGALRFETPYAESNLHLSYWNEEREISPHPHIGEPGEYCLGNAGDLLCEYISEQDLFNSVLVVIAFLEQCNEEDYAGKWVSEWTCIDEEGNEIDNPYDRMGNACCICDERMSEDNTYYCYECGETMCWSCSNSLGDGEYLCDSCRDESYTRCDVCDNLYKNEEVNECVSCGEYVCENCEVCAGDEVCCSESCREDMFTFCEGCDEYINNGDMKECLHCGKELCKDCMEQRNGDWFCNEDCAKEWLEGVREEALNEC